MSVKDTDGLPLVIAHPNIVRRALKIYSPNSTCASTVDTGPIVSLVCVASYRREMVYVVM